MVRIPQPLLAGICLFVSVLSVATAESPPDDFPDFIVPGHEPAMTSLRDLYWLHYRNNGPMATLWDEWLPPATLWPASGEKRNMRGRWAEALSTRHIDADGYVSTHQHDGTAHANGWPFPLWHQGSGIGWHFIGTGIGGFEPPRIAPPDEWKLVGATSGPVDPNGWNVRPDAPAVTMAPPPMSVDVLHAPFLRLNWRATGLAGATCYVEWTTAAAPAFSAERRVTFPSAATDGEVRTMIRMYDLPGWSGTITGLRIGFENVPAGATVVIKSLHTAYDSRHNVNNSNFIRGVCTYVNWTRDATFLRKNIERVRLAMRFTMSEFQTRQRKLVFTAWTGHEGTSGVRYDAGGAKSIVAGRGIGSNYWDLMPFGGEDALATIYYYDALRDLADLEQAIADHPQWNIPPSATRFDPADLRQHAAEVKDHAGQRFWNAKTGRFVSAIDRDGAAHDYGFTFLNTEAIYHSFATDEQARSIVSWLAGERTVEGDTSTGADIYHWRFGPRSTTKRNIDYYLWSWSVPEALPWGYQVQDGGAVLGWSYHDLMARLATRGPDNAWKRLREILTWFDEVQVEGGYRAYYREFSRGTLQGSNTAGGLGVDAEFVESVLVPQVMLYGFLGFQPTPDGFRINPKLPKDWPSLRVTRIHLHDIVIDVTASERQIEVTTVSGEATEKIELPHESKQVTLRAGESVRFDLK